jgi:hypothetical protein
MLMDVNGCGSARSDTGAADFRLYKHLRLHKQLAKSRNLQYCCSTFINSHLTPTRYLPTMASRPVVLRGRPRHHGHRDRRGAKRLLWRHLLPRRVDRHRRRDRRSGHVPWGRGCHRWLTSPMGCGGGGGPRSAKTVSRLRRFQPALVRQEPEHNRVADSDDHPHVQDPVDGEQAVADASLREGSSQHQRVKVRRQLATLSARYGAASQCGE